MKFEEFPFLYDKCTNQFSRIIIEIDFCDVTLACEDKQIKDHKLIISSCSLAINVDILFLKRKTI